MTSDDLRAWQSAMGYSYAQAHAELGVSSATYARMLSAGASLDRRTALACAALAAGLPEWEPSARPPPAA
ncbi:hypothetical protein [Acidovorax sp. SUPP2825]|uniref:hypothetical protein n=1 Tax=Acidovorax sp. SUPP2825 TaxID=2920879 RepID=UPI0023DE2029|nr:hypothetical protein [Acidovorax sp. SUPP2825]GKS93226.1 helix-turn-helix transcriptional regulator [Acidovorax sp. SUPP2825]